MDLYNYLNQQNGMESLPWNFQKYWRARMGHKATSVPTGESFHGPFSPHTKDESESHPSSEFVVKVDLPMQMDSSKKRRVKISLHSHGIKQQHTFMVIPHDLSLSLLLFVQIWLKRPASSDTFQAISHLSTILTTSCITSSLRKRCTFKKVLWIH